MSSTTQPHGISVLILAAWALTWLPAASCDPSDDYACPARVKALLVSHGVAPERIRISSRGESEARGWQAEYSHGYDRRVDIVVATPPPPRRMKRNVLVTSRDDVVTR